MGKQEARNDSNHVPDFCDIEDQLLVAALNDSIDHDRNEENKLEPSSTAAAAAESVA